MIHDKNLSLRVPLIVSCLNYNQMLWQMIRIFVVFGLLCRSRKQFPMANKNIKNDNFFCKYFRFKLHHSEHFRKKKTKYVLCVNYHNVIKVEKNKQ